MIIYTGREIVYNGGMERKMTRTPLTGAAVMVGMVWVMVTSLWALEVKKEFELTIETAPQYFVLEGDIHMWQMGKMAVYKGSKRVKQLEVLKKGEGPGDFLIIQNLSLYEDRYFFWDRMLGRMTSFSRDWKMLNIEKIHISPISAYLGRTTKGHIFKWSQAAREKNRRILVEKIGFIEGKQKTTVIESRGQLVKNGAPNHRRPHLIYTLNNGTLYYANNNKYEIFAMDVEVDKPEPRLFAKRDQEPVKWQEKFQELQYQVIRKPAQKEDEIFPKYVPPLFAIAVDKDWLAVVTNYKIAQEKAQVDLFKAGKYKGSVTLPLLYEQYFVFPSFLSFPPDFYISGNALFALHYDSENDEYKITRWSFTIKHHPRTI